MNTLIKYRERPVLKLLSNYWDTFSAVKCLVTEETEHNYITQSFVDKVLTQYPTSYCFSNEHYEYGRSLYTHYGDYHKQDDEIIRKEQYICQIVAQKTIENIKNLEEKTYEVAFLFNVSDEKNSSPPIKADKAFCIINTEWCEHYAKDKTIAVVLGKKFLKANNWQVDNKNKTISAPIDIAPWEVNDEIYKIYI